MIDYLIVGHGLAGASLAHRLLKRGKSVLVLDDKRFSSSRVAAGMWHPAVFKTLQKSWKTEEVYPNSEYFYKNELISLGDFLNLIPLVKKFPEDSFASRWNDRATDPEWNAVYKIEEKSVVEQSGIEFPNGYGVVSPAGFLDIPNFLNASEKYLTSIDSYQIRGLDFDKFKVEEEFVQFEEIQARNLIFCEGVGLLNNPWFNWLPLVPVKGELITLKVPGLMLDSMVNTGIFIIPIEKDIFRIGATFDWNDKTWQPTEEKKSKLLQAFQEVWKGEFEILEQRAGLRPTVADRRALVGHHPKTKRVWLLNGLGTKGVATGPWLAEQLVNNMLDETPIDEEISLERFRGWRFRKTNSIKDNLPIFKPAFVRN